MGLAAVPDSSPPGGGSAWTATAVAALIAAVITGGALAGGTGAGLEYCVTGLHGTYKYVSAAYDRTGTTQVAVVASIEGYDVQRIGYLEAGTQNRSAPWYGDFSSTGDEFHAHSGQSDWAPIPTADAAFYVPFCMFVVSDTAALSETMEGMVLGAKP